MVDRYYTTSVAYGAAAGLDAGWLQQLNSLLPPPDLTVLLDLPVELGLARSGGTDVLERDVAYQHRVRSFYVASAEDPTWVIVDASQSVEQVLADCERAVRDCLLK